MYSITIELLCLLHDVVTENTVWTGTFTQSVPLAAAATNRLTGLWKQAQEYQSENRRANPNKAEENPKGKDQTEVEKTEATNIMGNEE